MPITKKSKHKVGDLVAYCGNGCLYVVVHTYPNSIKIDVQNMTTGKISSLPSHWLTKIKTDKFCPLHSSAKVL